MKRTPRHTTAHYFLLWHIKSPILQWTVLDTHTHRLIMFSLIHRTMSAFKCCHPSVWLSYIVWCCTIFRDECAIAVKVHRGCKIITQIMHCTKRQFFFFFHTLSSNCALQNKETWLLLLFFFFFRLCLASVCDCATSYKSNCCGYVLMHILCRNAGAQARQDCVLPLQEVIVS